MHCRGAAAQVQDTLPEEVLLPEGQLDALHCILNLHSAAQESLTRLPGGAQQSVQYKQGKSKSRSCRIAQVMQQD